MPDASPSSSFLVALLALLPQRAAPRRPAAHRAVPPGPQRTPLVPLVPYPDSLRLLDVLDGALPSPSDPGRGSAAHSPDALAPAEGRELLERALDAARSADAALREMRSLAVHAGNASLAPIQRARLQGALEAELARLAELVRATAFQGIALLDGSHDARLLLPPTGAAALVVDLPDWRAGALGLPGSIATLHDAQAALDDLDVALDTVERDGARLALARTQLDDGEPRGGLREIERLLGRMRELAGRATSGYLNTADRTALDAFHASDLARLDAVAAAATFGELALLDGGELRLQGVLGTTMPYELPDASSSSLGLPPGTDVTTMSSAALAHESLGAALAEVRAFRAAAAEARAALESGVLRLR